MQSKFVLQPFAPHSQFSVTAQPEELSAASALPAAAYEEHLNATKYAGTLVTTPVPVVLRAPNGDDFLNSSVVAERCGVQHPNTGVLTYVIYQEQLDRPEHETVLRFHYREIEPVLYPSERTESAAWKTPIRYLREDAYLAHLFVTLVFGRNGSRLTHREEQRLLQFTRSLSSFQSLDARPGPARSNRDDPASDDASAAAGDQADASPDNEYKQSSAHQATAAAKWDPSEIRQRHKLPVFTELAQRLEGQIAENGDPVIDAFAKVLIDNKNPGKLETAVGRIAQRLGETGAGGSHE